MNYGVKLRLMEEQKIEGGPGAGGNEPAPVTYTFGEVEGKALAPEQVTALTEQAKTLGLTAEQATKAAPHLLKLSTPAAVVVPEKYTFAKVGDKDLTPEIATELTATAKALGLNAEQAQKFADYELKLRAEATTSTAAGLKKVQDGWKAELAADKDVGGAKAPETLALAKTALEKYFPVLAKNEAGFPFLDHPDVVKGLALIGKSISPDGDFVRNNGGGGSAEVDPSRVFFPKMA